MSEGEETVRELAVPLALCGTVVRGYRRGGQLLGYPTANLRVQWASTTDWQALLVPGVYGGFAQLVLPGSSGRSPVYGMAMSLGTNPSFRNTATTLEVHILHSFADDFYGATLRVVVLFSLRGMRTFASLGLWFFLRTSFRVCCFLSRGLLSRHRRAQERHHSRLQTRRGCAGTARRHRPGL